MKILISISLFLTFATCVNGQNNFGSLSSNFTPTNSLYINPSSILDAKVWLDVNVAGVGSYTNNNLVYLKDQRWFDISKDAIKGESRLTDEDVGYNQGKNKYHAYNRNFATGPSAVWSQGNHAAAISTGARSYLGVRTLPEYGGNFIENGVQNYVVQHDINYTVSNLKVAALGFGEIKGTYAYTFHKSREHMFMGGIGLSKLFAIGGAALNVYDAHFFVDDQDILPIAHFEGDAMYTPNVGLNPKGGWGLDLGFTFQKMKGNARRYYPNSKKMGCNSLPYQYKLGASIMDIGSLKFADGDYLFSGYNFDSYNWVDYADQDVNEDNVTTALEDAESNITQGQARKQNKIRLPTFASVQFDYNLWASKIYVNANIVQGIPVPKRRFGSRHANSLSVTPRFESFFFDFAIPFSLYEYRYPQMGASIRLGPITIGTDKLWSWIKTHDIYGADIYVHVKLPFRYNPKCRSRMKSNRAGRRRNRDRSPTKCTI
ncbi:MAG: hypothetical protein HRT57_06755 [Crocinitomicaceae bacterium]|nr:hypothetical protein [Crocinitomicaceae bacterium]